MDNATNESAHPFKAFLQGMLTNSIVFIAIIVLGLLLGMLFNSWALYLVVQVIAMALWAFLSLILFVCLPLNWVNYRKSKMNLKPLGSRGEDSQ